MYVYTPSSHPSSSIPIPKSTSASIYSVAEQSGPNGGMSSLQAAAASNVGGGGVGNGSGNGGELDNYARQNRHSAARLGRSPGRGTGMDVRYSSTTGTAAIPARMVLPSDTPELSDSGAVIGHPYLQHPSYSAGLANRSTPSMADAKFHDSGSLSGKNSPHIIHYAHQLGAPVGVTVTEPASGQNTPQLIALMRGQHRDASPAINSHNGHVVVSHYGGSSAPPSLVVDGSQAKGIGDPSRPDVVPAPSQFPSATESSSTTPSTLDYQNFSREHSPHPSMVPPHSHTSVGAPAVDRARMVQAELELEPFLWDVNGGDGPGQGPSPPASRTPSPMNKTSRGLAILHAAHLYIPDVRSTCEAFGALMSFRTEFCKSRGVIFVSYHDLRSARYAAVELRECLKRLATPRGTAGDKYGDILVQYCVPLNGSSASDESILVVGNLPSKFDNEQKLSNFMNSYGAVCSVRLDSLGEYTGKGNRPYIIEFYDDQDAKQALLELESDQPWGADAIVSVGLRHASERKQGQEFLALIGKWRKDEPVRVEVGATVNVTAGSTPSPLPSTEALNPRLSLVHSSASPASAGGDTSPPVPSTQAGAAPSTVSTVSGPSYAVPHPGGSHTHQHLPSHAPHAVHSTAQLAVGPDGQYSYVVVNQPPHPHGMPPGHAYVTHQPPVQQHIVHGPHGTYVTTVPNNQVYHHAAPHGHPMLPPQYHHLPPGAVISTPYGHGHPSSVPVYTHVHGAATDSSVSSGSVVSGGMYPHPHPHSHAHGAPLSTGPSPGQHRRPNADDDPTQLLLDINAVESGKDTRTSLMVRNIPNKYTQKMLLGEFAEAGHGSDKMDFFYLPIDFKNRCNRGYAFVNFVDCRDIAAFHRQYNGKQWKVFNSDKICDITYARIQGKAAMLKRFQNSALMEKEDDYRPVVFVSSGPDKGKREDFPAPTSHHHHHQHHNQHQQQHHVPHNPHAPQPSSSLASAAAAGATANRAHDGGM